jgi:hypothetical protein
LSLAKESHAQQKRVEEVLDEQAKEESEGKPLPAARMPYPKWWD